MTTASAFTILRAYIEAQWLTTPLSWENETFDTPRDGDGQDMPFVQVQMTQDDWVQESIGAGERTDNRWRESGDLYLNVIVPLNTGTATARAYATTLANLFRGSALDGDDFEFRDISIGLGVIAEDRGPWWLLPVRISWLKG